MPINSIDDLILLRRRVAEGHEPSIEELKEVVEFSRLQRGVRAAPKKEKAKVTKLDTTKTLTELFGL